MTFTEAAVEVLRIVGKPLHYKEITEIAIEKNLLSHVGKSPEVTMGARLAALLKKEDPSQLLTRIKPGVFGLKDWGSPNVELGDAEDSGDVNALEVEAASMRPAPMPSSPLSTPALSSLAGDDDDDKPILSGEDAKRADLAARGAELFDDEDDDDKPILGSNDPEEEESTEGDDSGDGQDGGDAISRRRRKRRRKGGRGREQDGTDGAGAATSPEPGFDPAAEFTAEPFRSNVSLSQRPVIRDRQQIMGANPELPGAEGDELSGKDLADAAHTILLTYDRNQGPVAIRNIADVLSRKGRLTGDPAQSSSQLSSCLRADNLKRAALGQRPRYRFASGGRVALTDWIMSHDLLRLEQEANQAVERYREAARRMLLRRIQELPGQAFVELALLALERAGFAQIKSIKKPGSPGGEMHFSAVQKIASDEVRVALVIRKDGREIGRERVSEVRGTMHHYNGAVSAWLVTTGQVLSGAKEEASANTNIPVALFDGFSFCKFLEDYQVGVSTNSLRISIPDVELFESIRGI